MFSKSLPVAGLLGFALTAGSASAQFAHTLYGMPTGYRARAVQMIDHSLNGWQDLVIGANGATDRIYRRTGPGLGLSLLLTYPASGLTDIEVARLDSNAFPDIVSAHATTGQLRIRRYPAGTQTLTLPASFSPQKVKSADLDNDGDLDLVTVGWGNARPYFARNLGAGVFAAPATTLTLTVAPSRPLALACADFNHDGRVDLIVPRADGNVSYFRNTTVGSSISFASPQTYSSPNTRPADVCADDFNGDGWLDFAVANGIGNCRVWLNQGPTGSSWTTVNFTGTSYTLGTPNVMPRAIHCGDYDCDGDVDLFVALQGMNQVAVLRNTTGAGTYTIMSPVGVGNGPVDITGGDLDRDGDMDLATANWNTTTGSVSRLLRSGTPTHKKHFYVGGISDNFSTATPASTEHACPRPGAFTTWVTPRRHFDQASCIRRFGHTFPNVGAGYQFPMNIVGARLSMRIRGDCSSASNDTFGLAFDTGSSKLRFTSRIVDLPGVTTYTTGTNVGISFDLSNLPGGIDLIPLLNQDRFLDVFAENGTRVDSIFLELTTCTRVRCTFSTKQDPFIAGNSWTIGAGGAPAGSFIFFFMSPTVGAGPILPGGMFCLAGPINFLGATFAPSGSGNITLGLPPVLPSPCVTVSTQAISWPSWCYSNTWTAQLFN